MNSQDILKAVREHGLEPKLGFKLKSPAMDDTSFFRKDGEGWKDHGTGTAVTEEQVFAALKAGVQEGKFLVVWDCCCARCMTEDKRQWTNDFIMRTGLNISHGYAPECFELEQARIEAEMEGSKLQP